MSESTSEQPVIPVASTPVDKSEHWRIGWIAAKTVEGALLGAIAVSGYAAADAFEDTEIHESIAGIEATERLQFGDVSRISFLKKNVYKEAHGTALGQDLAINVTIEDFPGLKNFVKVPSKVAGLVEDYQKAGEGIKSALEHEFWSELKSHELLFGEWGGGAGAVLFLGGALIRDDRRRFRAHITKLEARNAELEKAPQATAIASQTEQTAGTYTPPSNEKDRIHLKKIGQKVFKGVGVLALTLGISASGGLAKYHFGDHDENAASAHIPLTSLEKIGISDAYTDRADTKELVDLIAKAIDDKRAQLEDERNDYITSILASLTEQAPDMTGPSDDETAFLAGSDVHSNVAMVTIATEVVKRINERFGEQTIEFVLFGGDPTYGSSVEKPSIADQADIGDGAPEVAALGNHDTDVTKDQLEDADIDVLNGEVITVAGVPVLGATDPFITEHIGGPATPRGDATQMEVGQALYDEGLEDGSRPATVMHEGYAAGSYLGLNAEREVTRTELTAWFEARGSNTVPFEDGVRDLPASAVFYGHWHRIIEPRTVYNSDGTWTLVMELNTMGGASPHIAPDEILDSTPLGAPVQTASFPVLFRNKTSGLITGYQLYSFTTEGTAIVGPRVNIGSPDGLPYPVGTSEEGGAKPDRADTPLRSGN